MVLQSCTWGMRMSCCVPKSWGSPIVAHALEVTLNPSRVSKIFLRRCNIPVRLLTLLIAATSILAALVLLHPEKLRAGEVLRYDCSAQVYQAPGNERLDASAKKIGVPIKLKASSDELIIDEEVFKIVLRGAEQNQTVLFSAWYTGNPADISRIEIERMIVLDSLPSLRALGYHDLCVQIYAKDQGQVNKYMRGVIDEKRLTNTVSFLEETCGVEILRIARELGLKVWAIDPTYLYGNNWLGLFSHVKAGKIDGMMFKRLKRKIFNEDPYAKVLCILAGPYISEAPGLSAYPLGMRLNDFTNGRNFSVSIEGREYPNERIVSDIKIHIEGDTFYKAEKASPQLHQPD